MKLITGYFTVFDTADVTLEYGHSELTITGDERYILQFFISCFDTETFETFLIPCVITESDRKRLYILGEHTEFCDLPMIGSFFDNGIPIVYDEDDFWLISDGLRITSNNTKGLVKPEFDKTWFSCDYAIDITKKYSDFRDISVSLSYEEIMEHSDI